MKSCWTRLSLVLAVLLLAGPSSLIWAQDKDVTLEGQIKIGVHKLKFESNALYQFEVKAKSFLPVVTLDGKYTQNTADFFKEKNTFRGMFMPAKAGEYPLVVMPNTFGTAVPEGLLDYTVTLKTMKLEETPLLKKEDKIAADDPRYAQSFRKTRFKAYPVKLSKGKFYIIDMIQTGADNKLDPYLYLENPNKQIIAQDDDGGGFPNARIMIRATADGEYRIITSGLNDNAGLGDFTLTVRTVKDEK